MGVLVRVTDPSPDDHLRDYGAGALIRLERAASEAGVYAEIDTEPIVAATYSYEIFDPDGTATSWYRIRFSNVGNTETSDYGDPFSMSDPAAYATFDDYVSRLGRSPTSRETQLVARIEEALRDARAQLDEELGVDFGRHPETWTVDVAGGSLLHVHGGIVSLDSVEVRDSLSGSWTAVDAGDWLLEPDVPRPGEPYFHIRLTGVVSRGTWPYGSRLARLTGVRGWDRPPRTVVKANVDWARLALAADPSFAGTPQGPAELGRPTGPTPFRMPDSVWRVKRNHVERFEACWL